jgi:mRNA interferase MazF
VKRGELWTVAGGGSYTGKPRPALVLQDDHFAGTASVTVCPLTSSRVEAPLLRLAVEPTPENGLNDLCSVMIDKITTVPRERLGRRIGQLEDAHLLRVNRALVVFLGVAGGR